MVDWVLLTYQVTSFFCCSIYTNCTSHYNTLQLIRSFTRIKVPALPVILTLSRKVDIHHLPPSPTHPPTRPPTLPSTSLPHLHLNPVSPSRHPLLLNPSLPHLTFQCTCHTEAKTRTAQHPWTLAPAATLPPQPFPPDSAQG